MRRAGFGARYDELEAMAARGYDATVDWLPHPEREPEVEEEFPSGSLRGTWTPAA